MYLIEYRDFVVAPPAVDAAPTVAKPQPAGDGGAATPTETSEAASGGLHETPPATGITAAAAEASPAAMPDGAAATPSGVPSQLASGEARGEKRRQPDLAAPGEKVLLFQSFLCCILFWRLGHNKVVCISSGDSQ